MFERFLNPARVSPPDIDVDFEDKYRSMVLAYTQQKY
jgi:DNA polymerase-3 subunit alpha